MQILPTDVSELLKVQALTPTLLDDERSSDFLDLINEALEEREEEREEERTDAEALRSASMVQTPYARNSSNGVTYTLDEVCFTRQEVQGLYNDLIKAGAPQESLSRLASLADLPEGANLAQVLASVKGSGGAPLLSDQDKLNISSLLGQIDPSGVLHTNMQSLMMEGMGREALDMLLGFTGQLDPTGQLDISKDELLSLGRGLGLDSASLKGLSAMFGQSETLFLRNGQFGTLLSPAQAFFANQQAGQASLDKALKETLQKRISAARARTEKERQANELQNRDAMHSKVHIQRTVQENSRHILDDILSKAQEDARQNAAEGRARTSTEQAAADANTLRISNEQQGHNLTDAAYNAEAFGKQAGSQGSKENGKDADHAGQDKGNTSAWSDLRNKTEVHPSNPFVGEGAASFSALQPQQIADARSQQPPVPLARQAVQDVTQAMLSSLKDGGKRMDLQLSSQELGALTVTLTVRNGEVSALLRSEKSESVELLQQQLDYIRVNLEEQGLKVAKVEVQLQSQDEQNLLWQDLEQHNFQQEQQARREEFARLRNLASMRHSSSNRENSILEQSMHSSGGTAHYAMGGLNLVA
ncbi:MAG: flagellar hook-length control protein FliK [Desulfovibrio sp.]|nr:flagellar hook-length control protein FliK [Desulfovibrio sp.]